MWLSVTFLPGFGCLWLSVNFLVESWWVWLTVIFLAGCNWVWVSVGGCTVYSSPLKMVLTWWLKLDFFVMIKYHCITSFSLFWCLYWEPWPYVTPFSIVSIVDIDHVFGCWARKNLYLQVILTTVNVAPQGFMWFTWFCNQVRFSKLICINPFQLWHPDAFRRYIKRPVAWNWLINIL